VRGLLNRFERASVTLPWDSTLRSAARAGTIRMGAPRLKKRRASERVPRPFVALGE